MGLPHGSFVLILVTVTVLGILYLLNRMSEHFSNKLFAVLAGVILAGAIGIGLWLKHLDRPFQNKPRIAFIPTRFGYDANLWLDWSVFEHSAQIVQQRNRGQLLVYRPEQIFKITEPESLNSWPYLLKFADHIRADYLITGQVRQSADQYQLEWQLYSVRQAPAVPLAPKILTGTAPETIAQLLADQIQERLKVPYRSIIVPWTNPEAAKNLALAQLALRAGRLDSSLSRAEQAFQADSLYLPVRNMLSELYLKKGLASEEDGRSGLEFYQIVKKVTERSLILDSTSAKAYRLLGLYYVIAKRWGLAEQNLIRAWKLDPFDSDLYRDLAQLHPNRFKKSTGLRDKKRCLEYAIFLNPATVTARLKLADYYYFQSDEKNSLRAVNEILAINPNNIEALMFLGKIYISQGKTLQVMDVFGRVIQLNPQSSAAFYNLGIAYFNTRLLDEAERLFLRAIQLDEKQRDAYLYLAFIYDQRGNLDQAIQYYRLRLSHRKGLDDIYANQARTRLYELTHRPVGDSTQVATPETGGSHSKRK